MMSIGVEVNIYQMLIKNALFRFDLISHLIGISLVIHVNQRCINLNSLDLEFACVLRIVKVNLFTLFSLLLKKRLQLDISLYYAQKMAKLRL